MGLVNMFLVIGSVLNLFRGGRFTLKHTYLSNGALYDKLPISAFLASGL